MDNIIFTKTLEYYDLPVLLLAEGEKENTDYICSFVDFVYFGAMYLVAKISKEERDNILYNKQHIVPLLKKANPLYKCIAIDFKEPQELYIFEEDEVLENYYPSEGLFIDPVEPPYYYFSCPKCGSGRIDQFRKPTGPIWCQRCGFRVEKKEEDNPFVLKRKNEKDTV